MSVLLVANESLEKN